MGRKGKTQKHTAKEIAAKHKAAKERAGAAGGGGSGLAARMAAKAKANILCPICKVRVKIQYDSFDSYDSIRYSPCADSISSLSLQVSQPSVKSLKIHFDNKHPKDDWSQYAAEFETKTTTCPKASKAKAKAVAAPKKTTSKKDDLSKLSAGLASMKVKSKKKKKTGFLKSKGKK